MAFIKRISKIGYENDDALMISTSSLGYLIGSIDSIDANLNLIDIFDVAALTNVIDYNISYADFYLVRENPENPGKPQYLKSLPKIIQFCKISDLMDAIGVFSSNWEDAVITIHVQGGETFPQVPGDDYFSFSIPYNEGNNIRKIEVRTIERNLKPKGAATLRYSNTGLIQGETKADIIKFRNLKLFQQDTDVNNDVFMLSHPNVDVEKLLFVNSILQYGSGISENNPNLGIKVVNCMNIVNRRPAGVIQITDSEKHMSGMFNSVFITHSDNDNDLNFLSTSSTEKVFSSFFFNYGNGNITLRKGSLNSVSGIDPKLKRTIPYSENHSGENEFDFISMTGSPLIDTGVNSFYFESSESSFDIMGNQRVFRNFIIDKGPYESMIHKFSFSSNDIINISLQKLIHRDGEYIKLRDGETIYRDIYNLHDTLEESIDKGEFWKKFCTGKKMLIVVNEPEIRNVEISDKKHILVGKFEAFLDNRTNTIIFKRGQNVLENLFKPEFNNGRYLFYYDGERFTLSMYIENVYYKGVSGARNTLHMHKYGGNPIITR